MSIGIKFIVVSCVSARWIVWIGEIEFFGVLVSLSGAVDANAASWFNCPGFVANIAAIMERNDAFVPMALTVPPSAPLSSVAGTVVSVVVCEHGDVAEKDRLFCTGEEFVLSVGIVVVVEGKWLWRIFGFELRLAKFENGGGGSSKFLVA